jgi:hypothetical protein
MMNTIDTLKLALEALESTAHGQDLYDLEEKAIAAIKQALAAPVQEPVGWSDAKQAELNDWFLSLPEGRRAVLLEDKWMLAGAAFLAGKSITTPNVATQPAAQQAPYVASPRVPLTDEQIVDNFSKATYETQHFANFEAGVRFAENYHGITEKGQS